MSIINEALKKARERKKIKPETDSVVPDTLREKSYQSPLLQESAEDNKLKDKKAIKNKWVKFYPLIYLTGILIFMLIGIVIFKNSNTDNYPAKIPSRPAAKTSSILPGETADKRQTENTLTSSQYTATDTSEFLLTGIIHGEGAPMAIINDSVYMTGDMIGSARVLKITEDMVIIEDGGKELQLKVK